MSLAREARWAKKKEARAERKEAKYHNKAMVAAMRGKMCKAACFENKAQKMHIRAQEAHQRHENATLLLQTKRASCSGYNPTIPVQVQYLPGGTTVQTGAAIVSGFQSSTINGVQTSQQYVSVLPHQPTAPIQPFTYPPQQVPQNQASAGVAQPPQGGAQKTTTTYTYPPQGGTYASPDGQNVPPPHPSVYPPQQPPSYPGTGTTPGQYTTQYPAEPPPAYTP